MSSLWHPAHGRGLNLATVGRVLITERMHTGSVAALESEFDVVYEPALVDDRQSLLDSVGETVALVVRNRTSVDAQLLARAPNLRLVARLGVGLDNIDLDECQRRGVEVRPAIGANAVAVAEYVIAALLTLFRRAFWFSDSVIDGEWPRSELIGREISGKQLGLVGLGLIAREVAVRTSSLGMIVVAHDPGLSDDDPAWALAKRSDLAGVLDSSDAISIHVPLLESTRGLVDARAISTMRQGAVIVNTARGGIVDEHAVADALRSGQLGGAALDVFDEEPLGRETAMKFRDVPNLLLTPHIAGLTEESDERVGEMTVRAIKELLGSPN